MKKHKFLVFITLVIGAVSTALLTIYLLRDYLKDTPLGQLFADDNDLYDYFDEDFEEETGDPVEEPEVIPVKEKTVKVRRGYIPIKLHENN